MVSGWIKTVCWTNLRCQAPLASQHYYHQYLEYSHHWQCLRWTDYHTLNADSIRRRRKWDAVVLLPFPRLFSIKTNAPTISFNNVIYTPLTIYNSIPGIYFIACLMPTLKFCGSFIDYDTNNSFNSPPIELWMPFECYAELPYRKSYLSAWFLLLYILICLHRLELQISTIHETSNSHTKKHTLTVLVPFRTFLVQNFPYFFFKVEFRVWSSKRLRSQVGNGQSSEKKNLNGNYVNFCCSAKNSRQCPSIVRCQLHSCVSRFISEHRILCLFKSKTHFNSGTNRLNCMISVRVINKTNVWIEYYMKWY